MAAADQSARGTRCASNGTVAGSCPPKRFVPPGFRPRLALLAFAVVVIAVCATGVSSSTADIDNDLIFDDALDADWSPSKDSTSSRNAVSPVSSPILQAMKAHKKATTTASEEKPMAAKKTKKNKNRKKKNKKKKMETPRLSAEETRKILSAFEHDVQSDAAPRGQVDDEDYVDSSSTSGSGDDDDGGALPTGSGFGSGTEPPTREPQPPVVQSTPPNLGGQPVFFRSTILMPDLPCLQEYNNRGSSDYARLSSDLMSSIEPLYEDTRGDQVVTLVKVMNSTGCLVTVDLGTMNFDDERTLELILFNQVVRGGAIGSHRTSSEQFTFRKVEGLVPYPPPVSCADNEFQCGTDDCIPFTKFRDGHSDCPDGSDEEGVDEPEFAGPIENATVSVGSEAVLSCVVNNLGSYTVAWVRQDTNIMYTLDSRVITIDPRVVASHSQDQRIWSLHIQDVEEADAAPYECQISTAPIKRQMARIVVGEPTPRVTTPQPPCAPHEWQCADGTCIDAGRRCDRRLDCPDRSDESDCPPPPPCATNEFRCDDGNCIRSDYRCDRRHDCQDGSDETSCSCDSHEFQCEHDKSCIDRRRLCDTRPDCSDHSDERNCSAACRSDQFQCTDGNCIEHGRKCDGFSDCPDSSDETSCPSTDSRCQAHEFRCSDGPCIHASLKCDGRIDCHDRSDEQDCPCRSDQFRCDDGTCIDGSSKCNRQYDCPDYSDEDASRCEVVVRCGENEIDCGDGNCIADSKRCDGRIDCLDGRDERDSCDRACPSGQFSCGDGSCVDERLRCDGRRDCHGTGYDETQCAQCIGGAFHCAAENLCISSSSRCNGYPDCYDGSDERDCNVTCRSDQFQCADTKCINQNQRCDRAYDCRDGSDELNCTVTCSPYEFSCHDGECVDVRRKCDRRNDCRDGSDEWNCDCRPDEFLCGDGKCIPQTQRCDGRYDCNDYSDESSDCDPPECAQDQFRCYSGQCVSGYSHCDGNYDCSDRSDEDNCGTIPDCRRDQFKCKSGECIAASYHCDRKYDCRDGSDERECGAECAVDQYRCASGQCVGGHSHCDGNYDCNDRSDEANCTAIRGSILLRTYPDSQIIKQGGEVVFQCRDEGTQRAAVKWSRAGNYPLPPGSTDVRGRLTMPNIQVQHGGLYICSVAGVLPFSREQTTVNLTVIPFAHPTVRPLGVCERDQSTCQNGQCIARIYVCDGDYDCSDGSDELSCTKAPSGCEPREFECNNKKCILKIWRCDGENDCGDNSDESFCAPANQTGHCQYKEVKCGNTDQCIPKSFQCDGEMDCLDGTDEIGCGPPTIVQPPPEKVMVTAGETVVIVCIAVGTPTPLISWRLNWGHIGPPPRVTTTSENGRGVLTITNVQESDSGAYSCEAINSKDNVLATPDAILIVQPAAGVCRAPHFNVVAKTQSECVRCFCFGQTDQCFSSNLFITRLPHGTEITIIAASPSSSGSFIFNDQRYSLNQDLILHLPEAREFRIDDRFYRQSAPNVAYYWSLPSPFLGNKLNSYGGFLQYTIIYRARGGARPVFAPDVVITGNGISLYHRGQTVQEGTRQDFSVSFSEGNWYRLGPGSRADGSDPQATREEIMHLLQMLDSIWIRASYAQEFTESSLISLQMDTASSVDTGHGRAVYVEQCTCPPGYQGLSCESCASGYSRVRSGNYLGECRRTSCECHGHSDSCDASGNCYNCQHNTEGTRCERCRAGYYGDPRGGNSYDCQPCACPLSISSNQFSPTCFLDTDNQPTCNACPPGYGGRLCERCVSGYHGDPSVPGQGCTITQSPCHPIGAISPIPDPRTRLCQCKDFVAGPTCGQCQPDTFNLNEHSLGGCINCFCMAVTSYCGSSQLFRAEETVELYYDRAGFAITSLDLSQTEETNIRVNPQSRELTFTAFRSLVPGKLYYWRAPSKFLGNKLTSYGGNLTYTIRYSTALQGVRSPGQDVQITGNHIELNYYHPHQLKPQTTEIISVPLFERYWKRSDGRPATREHLMMALANLNTLLIKSMYTDQMIDTSIKDIKLTTTVNYDNGQLKAVEVEHCRCPIGYKGTSCEECDAGYARSGGGLYLGLCEPCFCNGHSSDCDTETGICKNCQHNTTGDFCEECAPGYHGDASLGTPYACHRVSPSTFCSCDARGTLHDNCSTSNRCVCKKHSNGDSCNECKPGYYNLEASNQDGCSKCFCFGHTDKCTSSPYFRTEILPTTAGFEPHGFTITDRYQVAHTDTGLSFNANSNELRFTYTSLQEPTLFFSLPSQFTGNRLTSYGGKLKFTLKFTSERDGQPIRDADIIIVGNDLTLQYMSPTTLHPDSLDNFEVPLTEAHWQLSDHHFRGPTTRENFMNASANIQAILIRASHQTLMSMAILSDIRMDTAVPQYTGQKLANAVEICDCPPGYSGLSCEECAPGYIRDPSAGGNQMGACIPCNCHGHSDYCDPNSRQCQRCHHNTVGPNCERCAEGYYGDATAGTPDDCRPCPCPLSSPQNQFSRSCYLDTDGLPTCHGCPAAYTGRNCEQCAPGFNGDPRQPGDTCRQPDKPSVGITVHIQEPKHQQVSEGDTVTFVCVGYTQVRNVTYNVVWTREDGRPLPSQAHEMAGTLTIRGLRTEDSGTYVCTGSDLYGVASDKAFLRVEGYTTSSPTVQIEPRTLEIVIGQPVEFRCISSGHPTPTIRWTRGHNSPLNPFSKVQDGVLRIPTSSRSDEGDYYCIATNSFGSDRARAVLMLKDDGPSGHPRVTIYPQSYDSRRGETVRFDCRVEGAIPDSITWSRAGQPLPVGGVQMDNMLVLPSVDETCQGIYICTALTSVGPQQTQATLNIIQDTDRPVATIEHEQQTVPQGSTAEIRCIVTGHPTPTIEWIKVSENLPANHQIVGTTLRITNVAVADRGVYVCRATNPDGVAQASAILEVERREPPAVELYPGNTQTIARGGSALFQCRVTAGAPSPQIEWTREDRRPLSQKTEIHSGGVIRFMHVTGEEQGRYVCTAKNEAGLVTAVVNLIIQGLPEITLSPPSPYTVSVGQSVRLECHTKGDPLPSADWRTTQPLATTRLGTGGYKESGVPGSKTLEISRVQLEDAGYYICTAQNSAGISEERLQLIVNQGYVPPQPAPQEFVVHEGARAELRCSTYGTDSSQFFVQWVRGDRRPMPAEHTIHDGVLALYNVQRQDAGEYNCLGMRNGTVQFSVSTTVVVVAPPRLDVSPVTVTARPGEAVTFRCSATGDAPIHIDWQKVEGSLSPSAIVRGGDLIFQGISVTDAGRYVCTARNHVGQAEGVVEAYINEHGCGQEFPCLPQGCIGDCGPNTIDGQVVQQQGCDDELGQAGCADEVPHISVPQKNQTVYVGSTVDLVCDAYGSPAPNVIWSRDRDSLPLRSHIFGNTLRINGVRVEDGGRYICTASNQFGSSTDYTILNVQGISSLSVSIEPSSTSVRPGDNIDIRCVVAGDASAVAAWSKIDEPLLSNVRVIGDTLSISNVRTDNGGIYRCTVNSYTGSYKEDYHLSIYSIPSLPQNAQVETQTAPMGSTVVMDCRADVQQPQGYTWTKQGGIMPPNVTIKGPQLTIPDVKVNDAGTYVCAVRGAHGTLDVPTILTVTGVVPYFAQAPVSFMVLPTLPDAYLVFDIEISFKPESPDGLILYNGQYTDGTGDFISFGLSRGHAEFRFDVGAGPVVVRSQKPLEIGKWHTVKLNRNRKDGIMTVNGNLPVNSSATGIFQGLDLIEPLYVGGVKNFSTVSKLAGFNQGFVGCISRLLIGNTHHELTRDAQVKVGVTTCETCAVNPCINNGVCQEAFAHSGYKCICQSGFSGLNCDKIGESCYQGVCGSGRCVDHPDGFQCYCPYGKGGRRCEKDITIYEAAFRDDAFIAYPTPKSPKKHKFLLKFKPRHLQNGLLMYSARAESGEGDFISLALKDKRIEFRFDTGSGPVVLRSANELKEDEWVTVVATRDFQEGSLLIDEEEAVRGTTPGSTKGLNLRIPLYVGGVDKTKVNLSPFVDVAEGFDGCIAEVEVGDVKLDMANALIDSANVDDCGGHAPCERLPCLNNGKCKETGPSPNDYVCTCEEGFGGRNCEEEEDICNVISPCQNGGTCIGTGTSYRCLCPVGFAASNCEKKVKFVESAGFQGDGYLILSRELLPHTSSTENEKITLSFSTRQKNGIILWHGQTPDVDGKGQDFLGLVIEDGYLVFSYELGSGPANIRSSIKVDDGRNHNVVLNRMGKDGRLELDDTFKEYGVAQGLLQMLNTKGNIYIGGLPNADLMTAGLHTEGFVGCISNLNIQESGEMHFQKQSIGGVNVTPCSGDEDYSGGSDYDNTIPK